MKLHTIRLLFAALAGHFIASHCVCEEPHSPLRAILVDAQSGRDILALQEGSSLNLAALPSRHLNVRAEVGGGEVQSVDFGLDKDTKYRSETSAPYTLAGDSNGKYNKWTPRIGSHVLTITVRRSRAQTSPTSRKGKTNGKAPKDSNQLVRLTIHFTVIDSPVKARAEKVAALPTPVTRSTQAPEAPRAPQEAPTAIPASTPDKPRRYRIRCGGPSFVARDGTEWQSDAEFTRAATYGSSRSGDDTFGTALYSAGRNSSTGPIEFHIPLAPGEYLVTLHFMERYLAQPGKSIFNIVAEEQDFARGVDLVQRVGQGAPTTIAHLVSVSDNALDLTLSAERGLATIAAIEIEPIGPIIR